MPGKKHLSDLKKEEIREREEKGLRVPTDYEGVFYRIAKRIDVPHNRQETASNDNQNESKNEKIFYIVYRKCDKVIEEKVGREKAERMTAAKASKQRINKMAGLLKSRQEQRETARQTKWTINKLWIEYKSVLSNQKSLKTDEGRFNKYLKEVFGNKEPREIKLLEIDRLKYELLKTKSPQTVKHVLTLLLRTVNFGVKRNLCEKLLFNVEKPKVDNIKIESLTDTQIEKFLTVLEEEENVNPVANLLRLALFTGMRRVELFKLQWRDIDLDKDIIHIRNPKSGQSQTIPINDYAKNVFLSLEKTKESSFVFPGKEGKQRVAINKKMLKKIKEKSGLPKDFRPLHGLRHSYASILATSGEVDMYFLQKLMTHKSPAMTQRYAHLSNYALRNASNVIKTKMDSIIKKEKDESDFVGFGIKEE